MANDTSRLFSPKLPGFEHDELGSRTDQLAGSRCLSNARAQDADIGLYIFINFEHWGRQAYGLVFLEAACMKSCALIIIAMVACLVRL